MLADELPDARLIEAGSILELRIAPDRLTNEIAAFVDECFKRRPATARKARAAAG
jgi:hypothetical protein